MKYSMFFVLLVAVAANATAQISKVDTSSIKKTVLEKPAVQAKVVGAAVNSPGTMSPSSKQTSNNIQQKATGSNDDSQAQLADNVQYIITGASISIKTGADAKEYPSKVKVYLFPMPAATYTYSYALAQLNLANAMNVNSNTEFGLTPLNQQSVPWPVYYSSGYNGTNKASNPYISGSHNWMLSDLQRQGFRLIIGYHPNLALDAWEIKQVTVKLKIEKPDGTLHPTLNNKTIVFNISTPMLGVPTGMTLVCEADKNFEPTTNYLTKDILID